jgi:phosphoribosyl-dephospho-CoA transferase
MRAHDLLRLHRPTDLVVPGAPCWVPEALALAPWVVVRRDVAPKDFVAVGVRGATREKRWATTISVDNIAARWAPQDLVGRLSSLPMRTPAARALAAVRTRLAPLPLQWGPTGSAGFELATGVETLTPASDLDIVLRVRTREELWAQPSLLRRLHDALTNLPARVDAQVDLDIGGIALEELLSGVDQVLVKTSTGPILLPITQLFADR